MKAFFFPRVRNDAQGLGVRVGRGLYWFLALSACVEFAAAASIPYVFGQHVLTPYDPPSGFVQTAVIALLVFGALVYLSGRGLRYLLARE